MTERPQMSREDFMAFILDHREKPRNNHPMDDPTVEASGGNPGCGDIVRIFLTVDADGKTIKDVHFTGEGCTISQASASILMELLDEEGKQFSLDDIREMDFSGMQDVLGEETVKLRPRCAMLSLEALKAAVRKYQRERLMREHGIDPATR